MNSHSSMFTCQKNNIQLPAFFPNMKFHNHTFISRAATGKKICLSAPLSLSRSLFDFHFYPFLKVLQERTSSTYQLSSFSWSFTATYTLLDVFQGRKSAYQLMSLLPMGFLSSCSFPNVCQKNSCLPFHKVSQSQERTPFFLHLHRFPQPHFHFYERIFVYQLIFLPLMYFYNHTSTSKDNSKKNSFSFFPSHRFPQLRIYSKRCSREGQTLAYQFSLFFMDFNSYIFIYT